MEIALFVTCVNDAAFPGTGSAVVNLLERLGHSVVFPLDQTCCGQMHANSGYRDEAARLARKLVGTFAGYETIVVPSASCAGTITELYGYLAQHAGDPQLEMAVTELAGRVYELSQLLVDVLGVIDVGARFPYRVAYHPTCHSARVLHLGDRPLRLLGSVDGLELVEIDQAESCCGFGGTFALKNASTSAAMGHDKVEAVRRSGAQYLCAADNSCLAHIGGTASRAAAGFEVVHLAEILASSADNPYRGRHRVAPAPPPAPLTKATP